MIEQEIEQENLAAKGPLNPKYIKAEVPTQRSEQKL